MSSGFSFMITLLCVGSLLSTVTWFMVDDDSGVTSYKPPPQKKGSPNPSSLCKGCKELIDNVLKRHTKTWKKNEKNYQTFISGMSSSCRVDKAIITQDNTPVGTKISFDGERSRTLQIKPNIFKTFIKEHPFSNHTFDTCAVVGNGGILMDSGCGKMIDSAQFVMRCNLPPLNDEYGKHVGVKTDLVTANPSILREKVRGSQSTAPSPPRAQPTNRRRGAQGTRDHRPHAAKPASDRNPRARPTVPPTRASSRPQTDAPGRGQGTRKAGDSQTPSQRETTPHTGRKARRPARGTQRLPATGREDRPRPTGNRAPTSPPPTPGERGEASPRPPHPNRPPQDHPGTGPREPPTPPAGTPTMEMEQPATAPPSPPPPREGKNKKIILIKYIKINK
nr:WAS/WASL-interacting protein family member 1-like isoform X2 [Nerophis lumbriciformis]